MTITQSTTKVIQDIRPVEALFLLSHAKKEEMVEEYSLSAVLGFLSNEGYIRPENETFIRTDKQVNGIRSLRRYEIDCLDAIMYKSDEEGLLRAITYFDFYTFMTHKGFFEKHEKEKWFILKDIEAVYQPTEKYNLALKELDESKIQITTAIKSNSKGCIDIYLLNMCYAFPNEGLIDMLLEYSNEQNRPFFEFQESIIDTVGSICCKLFNKMKD